MHVSVCNDIIQIHIVLLFLINDNVIIYNNSNSNIVAVLLIKNNAIATNKQSKVKHHNSNTVFTVIHKMQ